MIGTLLAVLAMAALFVVFGVFRLGDRRGCQGILHAADGRDGQHRGERRCGEGDESEEWAAEDSRVSDDAGVKRHD